MADPRAVVDYSEIDAVYVTMPIDNVTITYDSTKARGAATTMLDKAVSLTAAGLVQLASDAEALVGRIDGVEWDNMARIQVEGFCQLPGGSSATLTPGTRAVGALGASSAKGYIRTVASGSTTNLNGPTIMDPTDTTAVWVQF